MAGSASNWFRPSSGPLAGQAVYLSKQQQASLPWGSRQATIAGLNKGLPSLTGQANTQRPAGTAKTRALAGPGQTAPSGTPVRQTASGSVHQAPNGQFGVYDAQGKLFKTYGSQGGATRALNKLGGSRPQAAQTTSQTPAQPAQAPTRTPRPIGKTRAGYPKYKNDDFPIPTTRTASGKPRVVIMAGLPASGKSSIRSKIMGQDSSWDVVDADEIKKSIPGYDPKNPGRVHSESVRRAFQQVRNNQQSGKPFIWDVTGVNQQLPGTIRDLKRAGFEVDIMHVDVSQATATARNASRTRQVPSHVISNTSSMLPGALQDLKRAADNVLAIDNE